MAKTNRLNYREMKEVESALQAHLNLPNPSKFKSPLDLAVVLEKTLGFRVTQPNVLRVFAETDLNKDDFIRAGGQNSLMVQFKRLNERVDKLETRINELEELVISEKKREHSPHGM